MPVRRTVVRKQRPIAIVGDFGGVDVVLEISFEMMMTGHGVFFTTLFVETDPETAMLPIDVGYGHTQRGADAGEGKNEQADQRPVAQADDGLRVDAVEELTRFGRGQDRGLAGAHHVFGATHGGGWVHSEHLADHQPVEQHAYGRQPLLDAGRRKLPPEALDPGGDVYRLDVEQAEAGLVAPVEELSDRPVVGAARVRVADVGGEEFDEAAAGVPAARGDQCRDGGVGFGQEDDRDIGRGRPSSGLL